MAKDRPEKPAKGIKRKNGEKDISPKKRVNSGTTSGTTVGKNPGKNGVKSARKLAPHTVSKPPPTPAATKSSGKSDIPSSNARSNAAVSPSVSPFVGMLPRPFPSLSNSEPPPVSRIITPKSRDFPCRMTSHDLEFRVRRDNGNINTGNMASFRNDRSMDRSVRKQYTPITEPVSPGIFPGSGSQDMVDRDNAESVDSSSPAAPALHEDIEVLKTVFKDDDTGSPVPEYWSNICTKAFNNKLKKDKLSDLQKEYKPPENIKAFCKGPRLNSMVYRELPDYVRGKDKSLLEMQHKFAAVTTPLVRAIEMVDGSQPELDRRQLLVHLSHCLTFLGSAQFHVSMQRREQIRPHVTEKYRCLFNQDVPVTEYLLGNDAEKTIKEMKSVTDLRLRKPDRGKDTGKRSKGNRSSYYDKQYERKSAYAYGNKDANSKQTRKTNFNKWSQDNSKSATKKGRNRSSWFK